MSIFDWFAKKSKRPASKRTRTPHARLELETLESRLVLYSASGSAWPAPQLITISFMPDGTSVNGKSSNLFSTFNAKFGSAATWENQILKAAQQWAVNTNINFALVADSGAAGGSGSNQQGDPTFGDIRIGGYNFNSTTLAQATLPPPSSNYSVAGDIQLNTGQTFNIGTTYDLFTVAMHEVGHGLGLYHTTTTGAVMYSTYGSAMTGLTADDISGIQSVYGGARLKDSYDTAASNNTAATASAITASINTTTKAGVINSVDLTASTDVDWYKFVVPTGSATTLTVKAQSAGLSLLDPNVAIYDSTGATLKASGNSGAYGGTATATFTGITAGQTYTIKVSSTDAIAAFKTGEYALILNMGTGANPTPTYPVTQKVNGTTLQSGGGQALQLVPSETLVNTTTAGIQQTATTGQKSVATGVNGDYVVTWASQNQDGSGWGVYAQRYNSGGVAQGGEFLVNTTTTGDQTNPTVAMDSVGDFIITWQSKGQDGSGWGIYARVYTLLGVGGPEFRVNTTTTGDQTAPSVAMNGGGGFVIAWTSSGQDGSGLGVYAQQYNMAGLVMGGEFLVNTTTAGDQSTPSAIVNRITGDYVITWASAGQDGSGSGIYARRYGRLTGALGGEFRVNTTTAGDQTAPSIGIDRINGNFVIAWTSAGQDGGGKGVYAQRYTAAGVAVGGEFQVNTTTAGDQTGSSVAIDSNGNAFITWSSNAQDGSGWGVYGQIFNGYDGTEVDGEFRVNTITTGDQQTASVAISFLGQAVIAWTGPDANNTGVYAQRFNLTFDALDPGTVPVSPSATASPPVVGDSVVIVAPTQSGDHESIRNSFGQVFASLFGVTASTDHPGTVPGNGNTALPNIWDLLSAGGESLESLARFHALGDGVLEHWHSDRNSGDRQGLSDEVFANWVS